MAPRSDVREGAVRAFPFIILAAFTPPAAAQTLEILGHAGLLGEWELAGTVTPKSSSPPKEFIGLLKVTHVGICTQDGPDVKDGALRFQLSGSRSSRMKATLVIDGAECTYNGRLSDGYSGMMSCPDKRPVPLKIWVK